MDNLLHISIFPLLETGKTGDEIDSLVIEADYDGSYDCADVGSKIIEAHNTAKRERGNEYAGLDITLVEELKAGE
jgi:hypothetical protein